MRLFAIAVVAGMSGGYARGGRLGRLGQLRFRAPVLAGLALAVQAGGGLLPPSQRLALVVAGYVLLGVWLAANAGRRPPALRLGIALLALGWALNAVAMAPHRGMPVSADALAQAGLAADHDVADGHLFKHTPDRRDTPVDWLGDVIPIRPLTAVISVGDIVLLAGIAICVGGAMVPVPPAHSSQPAERRSTSQPRTIQAPGADVGGRPRRHRLGRGWREPAPPGEDDGATIAPPEAALAASGGPPFVGRTP